MVLDSVFNKRHSSPCLRAFVVNLPREHAMPLWMNYALLILAVLI